MIKVYMDESGTHDGSPVLTVGPYVGRPKEWREWTRRWNAAKRPIKIYHAVDAQNLENEFEGWDETRRDDLVKKILPVIAKADVAGICIGIHMHAFEKAISPHPDLRKLFGTPYTACFQWVVQRILQIQQKTGNKDRIAFFHEINDYQGEATESFKWVSEHANPNRIRMNLAFGTKDDYVPLQSADILAYEGNKRMRDPNRPERRAFKALSPDGKRLHVQHYGKDNMPKLIHFLREIKSRSYVRLRAALLSRHNLFKNFAEFFSAFINAKRPRHFLKSRGLLFIGTA